MSIVWCEKKCGPCSYSKCTGVCLLDEEAAKTDSGEGRGGMNPGSRIIRSALRGLAVCPECGGPATFSVTPGGLTGWSCRKCRDKEDLMETLDGLAHRGVITAEQAETAKRRILTKEGGAV